MVKTISRVITRQHLGGLIVDNLQIYENFWPYEEQIVEWTDIIKERGLVGLTLYNINQENIDF